MKEEQLELIHQAEENLLGSLLIAGTDGTTEAIDAVKRIVKPDDFLPTYHMGRNKRIYEGMIAAPKTDQLSVANAMWDNQTLQQGDIPYMCHLVAETITSLDYDIYAHIVSDLAKEWRTGTKGKARFKGAI